MKSNSSVDYFSADCLSGNPGIFQWVLLLLPDCGMNLCSWQERSLYLYSFSDLVSQPKWKHKMGSTSGVIPSQTCRFLQHFLLELLEFEFVVVAKMKNMPTKYNLHVFNECVLTYEAFQECWMFFLSHFNPSILWYIFDVLYLSQMTESDLFW